MYYVQSSATSARLLAKNDVQSWELLCYTLIISISIVGTFDSTQNLFHFLIFDYHSFSIRLLFAYKIPCLLIGYLVLTDDTLQISISTIQRIIQKNVVSIQIQKDATYDLDRKKTYLISNKSFRYYTLWSSIIFRHICI